MHQSICFFLSIIILSACERADNSFEEKGYLEIGTIRHKRIESTLLLHQKQSSTYILGDKILVSKTLDENNLFSPNLIRVIYQGSDSSDTQKTYESLIKRDTILRYLDATNYYFSGKKGDFIIYRLEQENASRLTNYPLKDREDKKVLIHKIRVNNFEDDEKLSPSQLIESYSLYEVRPLAEPSIYHITQKKLYSTARPFNRFIKFDSHQTQIRTLTINDLILFNSSKTSEGNFLLTFKDPIYGARFNYNLPVCKLLLIDTALMVLKETDIYYEGAEITKIDVDEHSYRVVLEFDLACSICDTHFCIFEIELNKDFEETNLTIVKYPEDFPVHLDAIKSKLSIVNTSRSIQK